MRKCDRCSTRNIDTVEACIECGQSFLVVKPIEKSKVESKKGKGGK